jgi:hypothetical protein
MSCSICHCFGLVTIGKTNKCAMTIQFIRKCSLQKLYLLLAIHKFNALPDLNILFV